MLASKNRALLAQRHTNSITLSCCPSKSRRNISIITRLQNTDLDVGEESGVGAETRDVGVSAGTVSEVVVEAGHSAVGKTGKVLS